ncbi:MAG: hypothetical protein M5U30_12825 [Burkholderiaceae bacterium]|nr:hypothetical protein [Burkholderiaceae bacterium]
MGSFSIALLEALVSAGVSTERARAVVDLLDRSIDERYSLHAEVLATKRDVAALQTETVRSIAELRGPVDARYRRERRQHCRPAIAHCRDESRSREVDARGAHGPDGADTRRDEAGLSKPYCAGRERGTVRGSRALGCSRSRQEGDRSSKSSYFMARFNVHRLDVVMLCCSNRAENDWLTDIWT